MATEKEQTTGNGEADTSLQQAEVEICGAMNGVLQSNAVKDELGKGIDGLSPITKDLLELPPDRGLGDLCLPCFSLAKYFGQSPAAIAKILADNFKSTPLVVSSQSVGPYVNFRFDRNSFSRTVLEDLAHDGERYGNYPGQAERLIVEYGQPNTHKEVHVGHLRNLFIGLSVMRLLQAAGKTVIPVSYIGDVGAHVSRCLWAYKKFHDGERPEPGQEGKFLGAIYTEATRRIEEDETLKAEVSAVQQALESGDPEWTALWQETRQWSLDEMQSIFREVGCDFDRFYYESEVEGPGKKLVRELLEQGQAEVSQGAIIMNLESEDLGVFLLLKSDGNSLYATKDLELAQLKFSEYKNIDTSIHIVDNRQSLYFRQLFAALKRIGFDKRMVHLAYDFVTLKEGAMSSRKGNVITYAEFRDEMMRLAGKETLDRHPDWNPKRLHDVAWTVVEGAMKFAMLRQDAERPIVFDFEEAMSFEGFTGPYVQYAHARMCSIEAKAAELGSGSASDIAGDFTEGEFAALRQVADLPKTVFVASAGSARGEAGRKKGFGDFNPSLVAQYAFDLAQRANDFYRDVPVLSVDGQDRARRLAIVGALRLALERSLYLLGIDAPKEM
ncbi:arginine--tRNA ligase [Candidatus Uhrbacteria bacterium CG_4_10_14_0_8_um_filter_58_22]|uniref:Arginine--tRNA ligase n=1 Tax=Candidatus Uhrbacteria bacterium CG_4_10_14_0_8_um_filter_58_22 TaxID=1975029 RepID=A0A2M7QB79_9BACT|nr:MAG: arginine--tRNA ligase [Parcubacteria group bacterium CG1_02_58_44]PIY62852.1 MAG: arginine--tRNA ligase [Candidatus Uhrbacteria bacterium CG_4_10_14_0_8_um_filter_58_22]